MLFLCQSASLQSPLRPGSPSEGGISIREGFVSTYVFTFISDLFTDRLRPINDPNLIDMCFGEIHLLLK